jgi:hypothetical protein
MSRAKSCEVAPYARLGHGVLQDDVESAGATRAAVVMLRGSRSGRGNALGSLMNAQLDL